MERDLTSPAQTKIYLLEHLDCAHCAAKMEAKIAELEGIQSATITFATKQLRITAAHPEQFIESIRAVCSAIEAEVKVIEREAGSTKKSGAENTRAVMELVLGAFFLGIGLLLSYWKMNIWVTLPVFVAAYLILGGEIIFTALKNLSKGQVFDENFLMSIATLGAFAIKEYPEAVGVMLFYRIGEYFEHRAVEKSRSQIMEAIDMRPEVVNLLVDSEIHIVAAEAVNPGDILLVRPGDRIPLDGRIIEGESRIDTSPITGEPVPVSVGLEDEVISGCVNLFGQLKVRIEKPLEESMVTRIMNSVENAAASKPRMERFITRFARIYTPVVVLAALATAVIPSLVTGDWNYWVYTALTFLVISCPCALVLSVPLAFFAGIGAGSRKGILFKGGMAIEAIDKVKAVVMDKTGTITKGNFILQEVCSADGILADELLEICASCEQHSTHPIASSIVSAAKEKKLKLEKPSELQEIAGHGIMAVLRGREILCGNRKLMKQFEISLEDNQKDVYGTEVLVAIDGKFAGHLVISDTIKSDAKTAIQRLKKSNLVTAMLTGDTEEGARAVAGEIGIDEVYAKLLPEDKLAKLTELREQYGAVMFVGDGINDAPVLAGANVGAAMGSGADAAIEAADVVFMTSNMEAIAQALEIAKASSLISKQNVIFALGVKGLVMILGLCGFASMWMAVFADSGVAMLCVLNAIRILYKNR